MYNINNSEDTLRILYLALLISAIGIGYVYSLRNEKISVIARNIGIWLLFFVISLGLYSYKDIILRSKIVSSLLPMRAVQLKDGSLMFSRQLDGAFHVEVIINGAKLDCIIDTGATNIVLSPNNIQNIGIEMSTLNFNIPVMTANGRGLVAKSLVSSLEIGPLKLNNVNVYINQAEMDTCLLGMSFLNQFSKVNIEGENLIIKP
ncbi:putative aspartyl protease [Rickettsiales bacterium Ac37b]|nr:putative aspartyl protease [Rickettsiales bacterium Ac37b]